MVTLYVHVELYYLSVKFYQALFVWKIFQYLVLYINLLFILFKRMRLLGELNEY